MTSVTDSEERDALELPLQINLGSSIVAIRGYGDQGVGRTFNRADELRKKLNVDDLNDSVINGLVLYFNVTVQLQNTLDLCWDYLSKIKEKEFTIQHRHSIKRISRSLQVDRKTVRRYIRAATNKGLSREAHSGIGIAEQFRGNFAIATKHLSSAVYVEGKHIVEPTDTSIFAWLSMNAVYCAGHLAWNLWIEGFPERAITPSLDAKRMAEKSGNPFNEVHYYGFAGFLHQCRGDIRMTLEVAKENLHLSQENGYQLNIVWATMQKGILDVLEEKREEGLRAAVEGLEFWKAVGMRVFKVDLFILDDFAFRKIDQRSSEWLYEIVDRRSLLAGINRGCFFAYWCNRKGITTTRRSRNSHARN